MRLVKGALVLVLAILTAVVIQAARNGRDAEATPLPVHGQVEGFTLIERDGSEFSSISLMGRVWIADFIFTRCASTCPQMTAEMGELVEGLAGQPEVRFVSFTVDPAHDSPSVLARYADAHGADRERWFFLTGPQELIYGLARRSFHLGVEEVTDPAAFSGPAGPPGQAGPAGQAVGHGAGEPFIHSTRFVLVDRQGRIRGYYDSTDVSRVQELRADLEALLREPSPPPT